MAGECTRAAFATHAGRVQQWSTRALPKKKEEKEARRRLFTCRRACRYSPSAMESLSSKAQPSGLRTPGLPPTPRPPARHLRPRAPAVDSLPSTPRPASETTCRAYHRVPTSEVSGASGAGVPRICQRWYPPRLSTGEAPKAHALRSMLASPSRPPRVGRTQPRRIRRHRPCW